MNDPALQTALQLLREDKAIADRITAFLKEQDPNSVNTHRLDLKEWVANRLRDAKE